MEGTHGESDQQDGESEQELCLPRLSLEESLTIAATPPTDPNTDNNTPSNSATATDNQDHDETADGVVLGGYAAKPKSVRGYSPQQSHREEFNMKAFGLSRNLNLDKLPSKTSTAVTPDMFKEMIHVIENWGPRGVDGEFVPLESVLGSIPEEELTRIRQFRKSHAIGYQWTRNYRVEDYTEPTTGLQKKRLIRATGKHEGKIAVPMHYVFDYISDAHSKKSAHAGRDVTYGLIKETCFNISQHEVMLFIKTCPACRRRNFQPKKLPGAKKPIISNNFRDRFQVDLIDMRSDPQKDIYGTLMKWICSIRDHFTGFTVIRAIPRKRPKYVAHVLEELWAIIGYPKIFHTDNGNEFTSREIISVVKSINPNILTVTGRKRKPSDQGSVERCNALIERKMNTLLDEQRIQGVKNVNWVTVLPQVRIASLRDELHGLSHNTLFLQFLYLSGHSSH